MKKFNVKVYYSICVSVGVKARGISEAREIAENMVGNLSNEEMIAQGRVDYDFSEVYDEV